MKNYKKIISGLLATTMAFSLAACGKSSSSTASTDSGSTDKTSTAATTAATTAKSKEPVALSMLIFGDNTPPDTNSVVEELEKKTNTELNVTFVAWADKTSKLNTLIAAQDLPDIIPSLDLSLAKDLKKNGMLADLTEYVKNAPNIQSEVGEKLTSHPLNEDGKVYGLFGTDVGYAINMNVRTDWLKNLGMEMPTDLDSLYNVLSAFTFKDPDKDGQNDTVGLIATNAWGNFTSILGAFGVASGGSNLPPYQMKDGTVTTGLKNEGFLGAIKYINKLYADGVLDPDFATIPAMDCYGKLWNGKAGAIDFQCVGPTNNWMPARYTETPVPTFGFAEIKGPSGVAAMGKMKLTYDGITVVNSKCKDPEAAVRVLDYFMSEEGDTLVTIGIEDKHYNWTDKANAKYKMITPYDDGTTSRNDGVYVYSGILGPQNTMQRRGLNTQTKEGVASSAALCTIDWPYIYTPFTADKTYGQNLHNIEKEVFCQLISTKGDIEKEYQAAVKRWETEGGLDWEKEATAAFKSQK